MVTSGVAIACVPVFCRLFVVVMAGVAIAWVPVVKETQGGQVFIYIQEVSIYLAQPVACIYLLAILWPRCNEKVNTTMHIIKYSISFLHIIYCIKTKIKTNRMMESDLSRLIAVSV